MNSSPVDGDGSNDDKVEVKIHSKLRRGSSDPNLTLISVYSSDTSPSVQVNVQHSTPAASASHTSQLFSLFKLPKRTDPNASASHAEPLQSIEGVVRAENSKRNETIVEGGKMGKKDRRNRFLSFVRYLFCEFVSASSHSTITPSNAPPAIEEYPVVSNADQQLPSTPIVPVEPAPKVGEKRKK